MTSVPMPAVVLPWSTDDMQTWLAGLRADSLVCRRQLTELRERSFTLLGEAHARLEDDNPFLALDPALARLGMLADMPPDARRRVLSRVHARDGMRCSRRE